VIRNGRRFQGNHVFGTATSSNLDSALLGSFELVPKLDARRGEEATKAKAHEGATAMLLTAPHGTLRSQKTRAGGSVNQTALPDRGWWSAKLRLTGSVERGGLRHER
jgi:hypothetical protein